jgi:hypothetical protein
MMSGSFGICIKQKMNKDGIFVNCGLAFFKNDKGGYLLII